MDVFVTWHNGDSFQSTKYPKGSQGSKVSQIYTHSNVTANVRNEQIVPQLCTSWFELRINIIYTFTTKWIY